MALIDSVLEDIKSYRIYRPYQDVLNLGGNTPNALNGVQAAGTESAWIDCKYKYKICLAFELSASNVTAKIGIILGDGSTQTGRLYTRFIRVLNSGRQEGIRETNYYHGYGEHVWCDGAIQFKVLLAQAPTNGGFISVFAGAI